MNIVVEFQRFGLPCNAIARCTVGSEPTAGFFVRGLFLDQSDAEEGRSV